MCISQAGPQHGEQENLFLISPGLLNPRDNKFHLVKDTWGWEGTLKCKAE